MQLEFSEVRAKRIKELMEQMGVENYKEFFNNALGLIDWAVQQVQQDRVITSLDQKEKKYRELSMPTLQHAAQFQLHSTNAGAAAGSGI